MSENSNEIRWLHQSQCAVHVQHWLFIGRERSTHGLIVNRDLRPDFQCAANWLEKAEPLVALPLNPPKRGCFKVDQVKDQGRTSEKKLSWLEVFGSK